jgi:long-chain acyl-CoA synthetase
MPSNGAHLNGPSHRPPGDPAGGAGHSNGALPARHGASGDFSARQAFRGRRVLFLGGTGFVGKVTLSMLLTHYGEDLETVYVIVRPGAGFTAERRFYEKVVTAPPFDPMRQKYGQGLEAWLRTKVVPLPGDVARPSSGLDEETVKSLEGKLDVIVNSSGHVSFNPPLEQALNVNVFGVQHLVALAKRTGAALVHVSTCFTRGNRSGESREDAPIVGYFPRVRPKKGQWEDPRLIDRGQFLDAGDFSLEQEIADCRRLTEHVRARADDKALLSMFRQKAKQRLEEEGRDPDHDKTVSLGVQRERKLWVAAELAKVGIERAQHWGWPNIYTYTKSLGDQVVSRAADEDGLRVTIVRPAIVESAIRFPFPGWNEGFTTTAPLAFLSLKGHRTYPTGHKLILDVIPVDLVAAGLLSATAATLGGIQDRVYQLGSGDTNPLYVTRAVEFLGIHKRKYFRERETGPKWLNELLARAEPVSVSRERYEQLSAPMFQKAAKKLIGWLDEKKPRWGARSVEGLLETAKSGLQRVEEISASTDELFQLFMPFMVENHYTFSCENTRKLFHRLTPEDQALLTWDPDRLDWLAYFMEVHLEGLKTWVFPSLEEEFAARGTSKVRSYTYRDLLEMFEAATRRHRGKVALRLLRTKSRALVAKAPPNESDGGESELNAQSIELTYGDLGELAERARRQLLVRGVAPGDRVMLLSENRPEWGVAYFGVLKAGAACVPVDSQATPDEVLNLLRASQAKVLLLSAEVAERLEDKSGGEFYRKLEGLLEPQGLCGFSDLLEELPPGTELPVHSPRAGRAEEMASLIFTSGTTGKPKGVMLSHHNFTSLVSKVSRVFDMTPRDGLLGVLPLHHTFEFTCGLLVPLSRGAQITYIDEITADSLNQAFGSVKVTAMIGVPALWQLLHRRIHSQLADRGPVVERVVKTLFALNRRIREKAPLGLNLGPLLFRPVHEKLGGRMRLLVSGGSALPPEVMETFYDLGFNLHEGYGLTEASPVLSVSMPGSKLIQGTVGPALPGIELKIHQPDADGIGEVIARGPNVMLGYYQDADATAEVIQDGWLHTGDLGKIDDDNRLYIVGRSKDVIVEASGKNVYPDEVEELYGGCPYVKEMSVVGLPEHAEHEGGAASSTSAGTSAERVACLVVPDYERGEKDDLDRAATRARVESHFREVSNRIAVYKRVKVLKLRDGELPKTATRKVKRKLIVEELRRLLRAERVGHDAHAAALQAAQHGAGKGEAGHEWLLEIIATVSQKGRSQIRLESRFSEDLGFDSLMYAELAAALESAGVDLHAGGTELSEEILTMTQVGDLAHRLAGAAAAARKRAALARPAATPVAAAEDHDDDDRIQVPTPVAELGRLGLQLGRRMFYEKIFDVEVSGRAYIPPDRNFIVAANHASHLDIGLVKHALGEYGKDAATVAAKDYFFGDPIKRAFFESMTNLVPMDREGSLRQSLKLAQDVLERGQVLILFPEGTRSTDGVIDEFKPSLGFLAIHNQIDILPIYLDGTHEAMPKGQLLPGKREMGARIGPVIGWKELVERTRGMSRSEGYRVASDLVRQVVLALKDGGDGRLPPRPDAATGAAPEAASPTSSSASPHPHPGRSPARGGEVP